MTKIRLSENSEEELVALLQRRGKVDTENTYGFKWQSFPGLCEITCYGKAELNESSEQALKREMFEELGENASKTIFRSKPVKIYEKTEKDGDNIFIWAVLCDKNILKEIKLDISTGGIEIVDIKDLKKIKYFEFGNNKDLYSTNLDEIIITTLPLKKLTEVFNIFN